MKVYGVGPYQNEKADLVPLLYVVYSLQRVQIDFEDLKDENGYSSILLADLKLLLIIASKYQSDINLKLKKDRIILWEKIFLEWCAENSISEIEKNDINQCIIELKNYGYPQKWLDENFMKSNIVHASPEKDDTKDFNSALNFVVNTYFSFSISEIKKSVSLLSSENEICQTLVAHLDFVYTLSLTFPSKLIEFISLVDFLTWENSFKDWYKRVCNKLPPTCREGILLEAELIFQKIKMILENDQ
ncbi:hypothetical protein RYD26_12335 [Pasteurellaceae bacterium LIM206]|nr:hypothetical protein [Pasteurellaceae bacterium LIM206]